MSAEIADKKPDALEVAAAIRQGFADYNERFRKITQRAKARFEERDWQGARADAVERIGLYDVVVEEKPARKPRARRPKATDEESVAAAE